MKGIEAISPSYSPLPANPAGRTAASRISHPLVPFCLPISAMKHDFSVFLLEEASMKPLALLRPAYLLIALALVLVVQRRISAAMALWSPLPLRCCLSKFQRH